MSVVQSTTTVERKPRTRAPYRPAAEVVEPRRRDTGMQRVLRVLGALAVLVVGAVHLEQYFGVHYRVVPVIGPLFLLNFIGATALGLLLLAPTERIIDRMFGGGGRAFVALLALGAIALAVVAFVFLFLSEHMMLFGFEEYGYRGAIYISLAAEAATAVLLMGYLGSRLRR
jgi:hypothetical protein